MNNYKQELHLSEVEPTAAVDTTAVKCSSLPEG